MIAFINKANSKELELLKISPKLMRIGGFDDANLGGEHFHCEVGNEALVAALLCALSDIASFDVGELSGESCLGEEEAQCILDELKVCKEIFISEELLAHPDKNLFVYLSLLADKFQCCVYYKNVKYSASEYKRHLSNSGDIDLKRHLSNSGDLTPPINVQDYDGIVIYSCLDEGLQISPAAMKLAQMKRLDLSKKFGQIPQVNSELKGLFILAPKDGDYAFRLLKEQECK